MSVLGGEGGASWVWGDFSFGFGFGYKWFLIHDGGFRGVQC